MFCSSPAPDCSPQGLSKARKHRRAAMALLAVAAVAAATVAFALFDPSAYLLWPKCPFRLLTGLSCPACGIQRFAHALLQGRVLEAVRYNWYLLYSLPYTLLVVVTHILSEGPLRERMSRLFEGKVAVWTYVVSFMVWLVVRNVMGI